MRYQIFAGERAFISVGIRVIHDKKDLSKL